MNKKSYWPFLLLLPLAAAAIAGWFLLPDELVVQIGVDGQPSKVWPKLIGLLAPVALGAVGAGIASGKEKEKRLSGLVVIAVAAIITAITFVWNI